MEKKENAQRMIWGKIPALVSNIMKRTLFITIGSASLLLIFILWVYLFLFGTPRSVDEIVGDFGFNNINATPINANPDLGETRQIDLSSGTLYQLTTRPVAGFAFVSSASSSAQILYAERGTGHIYQIDTNGGNETRLLQKTFVAINRAYFADDGSAVALLGDSNNGTVAYLEEIDPNRTPHEFPGNAENIAFLPEREVRYTISNENGTAGYNYDLDSAETDQLFGIPLKDVAVIWSPNDILVYSRTSASQKGSLYRVSGSTLTRAGFSGPAYSAMASDTFTGLQIETFTHPQSGNLVSRASGLAENSGVSLGITALPEKCAFDSLAIATLWCASPATLIKPETQTSWYKGMVGFSDFLWKIDLESGTARETDNLFTLSGREIDVIDMTTDPSGTYLIFKNKNDDTLWLKRIVNAPAPELNAAADEDLLSDGEEVTDGEVQSN